MISLQNKKEEAFAMIVEVFKELDGLDLSEELKDTDWVMSQGLLNDKGKLIAVYLLGAVNEPFGKLSGLGVQGIALAIIDEYRGQGLSKKLLNYSYSLPFDYIWGEHDKRLNNLHNWLKIRQYLGETKESFYTFKILAKN